MSTAKVEKVQFRCDADGTTVEADNDVELPPRWLLWDGKHFDSVECLARHLRQRGPVQLGLKTVGTGNGEVKTLDEVLSITARPWEHFVGCQSCGGKRGQHNMGCSIHR